MECMIKSLCPPLACLLILSLLAGPDASAQPAPPQGLRAGAATANITPPLGGFNPSSNGPATRIHDELHARCLLLDDGRIKLALVVCDQRHVNHEMVALAKQHIQQELRIPPEHVLISATHTHSVYPPRSDDSDDTQYGNYRRFLARRIADAVRIAHNNLQPARLAFGAVDEPSQVFNRRWFLKPGSPNLMGPFDTLEQVDTNPSRDLLKPAGPTDPQIAFLSVQSMEGRSIAVLANYSLHYVGGGTARAITADYFGMFADSLQRLLKADRQDPPFVGIMSNGTSGDINNIERFVTPPPRESRRRYAPWEKMREVADLCAQRVFDAHAGLHFRSDITLAAVQRTLTLETRKPTPEQIEWAQAVKARKIKPMNPQGAGYAYKVLVRTGPDRPKTIDVTLQAFRIGDVAIAAIPFEVFVEIGLELKQRSAIKPMFTISIANGSHGYLPTQEQLALGGYETWLGTNDVEPAAARKITDALLEMIGGLQQQRQAVALPARD